jgi:hypothetical protein
MGGEGARGAGGACTSALQIFEVGAENRRCMLFGEDRGICVCVCTCM